MLRGATKLRNTRRTGRPVHFPKDQVSPYEKRLRTSSEAAVSSQPPQALTAPPSRHGDRGNADREASEAAEFGKLISDTKVRRELSISRMTIHRWDRDPRMTALGWPVRQHFNGRNYRDAEQYEQFRARLVREAIARRAALLKQQPTEKENVVTA